MPLWGETTCRLIQKRGHVRALSTAAPSSRWIGLNPKSEIKTANLHQSLGYKRFAKISPDRCGYGLIFAKRFCSNILTHLGRFYFGFQVKARIDSGESLPRRPPRPIAPHFFSKWER
jgi:hypothetical protein